MNSSLAGKRSLGLTVSIQWPGHLHILGLDSGSVSNPGGVCGQAWSPPGTTLSCSCGRSGTRPLPSHSVCIQLGGFTFLAALGISTHTVQLSSRSRGTLCPNWKKDRGRPSSSFVFC